MILRASAQSSKTAGDPYQGYVSGRRIESSAVGTKSLWWQSTSMDGQSARQAVACAEIKRSGE